MRAGNNAFASPGLSPNAMLTPSVVQIIDKYLRFLCKISLKPLCTYTDNSLQKLQIFILKAISCSDSFFLSTS